MPCCHRLSCSSNENSLGDFVSEALLLRGWASGHEFWLWWHGCSRNTQQFYLRSQILQHLRKSRPLEASQLSKQLLVCIPLKLAAPVCAHC
eukprot:818131-Amphidinium_carterae.1